MHPKTRKQTQNKQTKTQKKKRVYSEADYQSGEGMLTSVWGPAMWHYLHAMSFNYPVHPTAEQKLYYKRFIYSLRQVLPCKYCRINLTNNLNKAPIRLCHLANRDAFSRYVYELHELVNTMLGKSSNLTFCQVRDRYEHFRSRCTVDPQDRHQVFTFATPNHAKETKGTKEKEPKGKEPKGKEPKGKEPKGKEPKEKGCTEPMYGKKAKCIIHIVPQEDKTATFQMDKTCIKNRK